ncbi:MAG: HEPN domain-containing protein [Desulforhopalus sp.]
MIVQSKNQNITGKFKLVDGREVFGSISICGEASKVDLFDDTDFSSSPEVYQYIIGELHDGRLVSLFQCILANRGMRHSDPSTRKYSATIFPHYTTIGSAYVSELAPCISNISFVMENAPAIFYDFDAFSSVIDTEPFVPLLLADKAKHRQIRIGDHPEIVYFTGIFDIAVVETVLGEVKAHHRPTYSSGGPRGVSIDNEVMVSLKAPEPITFQDSVNRLSILLRFFELILGLEQPLRNLEVETSEQPESFQPIEMYRSFAPSLSGDGDSESSKSPHVSDILVSIIQGDTTQYSTVLKNYLASDSERHNGRGRLQNSLRNNHHYTIDRVIAAANNFDILPDSIYPTQQKLTQELMDAKKKARELFKPLPDSIERSAMLGAIGRIGKLSLKHKIRHRATSTGLDKHFPRLIEVLDEAVNCRNHYVHGTSGKIDYSENFDALCFFTDALEFAFAASDLIDADWNLITWKNRGKGQSHPFSSFTHNYPNYLTLFDDWMRG